MPPANASPAGAVATAPRPLVLIVEVDDDTRALYRQVLEHLGYVVIEAADGREALTKAFTPPPDLIVTETTLPFVDGYSLCQILRRDRVTTTVPILVVTDRCTPCRHGKGATSRS
jgi:DNA-binding response OmpR family regulator